MKSITSENEVKIASIFLLLAAFFVATVVADYAFLTPTNGVGTVTIPDNVTYPHFFFTLQANTSGLRFTLFSTTPQNSGFQIDPATGQVYIDAFKASQFPPLQYESVSQYVLLVLAFDSNGIMTITGTLTVSVSKVHHAPVFTTPVDDLVSIPECTTLPNVIYSASAVCAANDAPVSWSIDYVTPTGNGTLFNIDVRGRILLVDPGSQLNYTVVPQYIIYYFAADNFFYLTATATLTVRVSQCNHPPVISNLPSTITIPSNIIAPTPFYFLSISDPDDQTGGYAQEQSLFKYSFSVNPIEGFQKFSISTTGTISTVLNSIFNYTSQPYYLMTIWVVDWDTNPKTASGTLNITIIPSVTFGSSSSSSGSGTSLTSTSTTTASTSTSSSEVSTETIIGAVVGTIGGLLAIGGLIAASLLCCKGRGTVQIPAQTNTSSSSAKTTTVYEDEHIYFGKPPGQGGRSSAIVSPFNARPRGARL